MKFLNHYDIENYEVIEQYIAFLMESNHDSFVELLERADSNLDAREIEKILVRLKNLRIQLFKIEHREDFGNLAYDLQAILRAEVKDLLEIFDDTIRELGVKFIESLRITKSP